MSQVSHSWEWYWWREKSFCFLFNQLLTLKCVYQTLHPPCSQASWDPRWQWRFGTTFLRENSSTAGRHWLGTRSAEVPLYSHLSSGSKWDYPAMLVAQLLTMQRVCPAWKTHPSLSLCACSQAAYLACWPVSQTLFHQLSWNSQCTDLHTRTWNQATQVGTWAWEPWLPIYPKSQRENLSYELSEKPCFLKFALIFRSSFLMVNSIAAQEEAVTRFLPFSVL